MATKPNIKILLSSAVVIAGVIHKKDDEVVVEHSLAQDLLRRGRCTLADVVVDDVSTTDQDDDIDLTKLTKAQLLEQAAAYKAEVTDSMTKAELIEAIVAAAEAEQGAE